jgi:hypothetical protein
MGMMDIMNSLAGSATPFDVRRSRDRMSIVRDIYELIYPHILKDFRHNSDCTTIMNRQAVTPADHTHVVFTIGGVTPMNRMTDPATVSTSSGMPAKSTRKPNTVNTEARKYSG